jgi:hypothetical protein
MHTVLQRSTTAQSSRSAVPSTPMISPLGKPSRLSLGAASYRASDLAPWCDLKTAIAVSGHWATRARVLAQLEEQPPQTRQRAPQGRCGASYGLGSVGPRSPDRLLTLGLRLDPLARTGGADEHLPFSADDERLTVVMAMGDARYVSSAARRVAERQQSARFVPRAER